LIINAELLIYYRQNRYVYVIIYNFYHNRQLLF